jgi:hypothetical protein
MQERQHRKCAIKAAKEVYKKGSTGNVQKSSTRIIQDREHRKRTKKGNTISNTAHEVCKKGS